jgi:hypothetical protein
MATIGLVELPSVRLVDDHGCDWTMVRRRELLGSKQILAGSLAPIGHEVALVNMRVAEVEWEFGSVAWSGRTLHKIACGAYIRALHPRAFDVWGITVNFQIDRELACRTIRHLTAGGGRVVVGGSDVFADPWPYLAAGATVGVLAKDGAANRAAVEFALTGRADDLHGVALPSGQFLPQRNWLHPEDWPLPPASIVVQTLGYEYWEGVLPETLYPMGMVYPDIGCDRGCDFCETWQYRIRYAADRPGRSVGNRYRYQSPERVLEWAAVQQAVGARSVMCMSDQFLGRVLFGEEGRAEAIAICDSLRARGLPFCWPNGLELSKAMGRNGQPDEGLITALWGWNGRQDCVHAYIPAERPVEGPSRYAKLLEWQQHKTMLRAITAAGVPRLSYGVIIGLENDSHDSLRCLVDHLLELKAELKTINLGLQFWAVPFCIRPIPGTPRAKALEREGLVALSDSTLAGGYWTATCDTRHLTYHEVAEWQRRILETQETPW